MAHEDEYPDSDAYRFTPEQMDEMSREYSKPSARAKRAISRVKSFMAGRNQPFIPEKHIEPPF